MPSLRKLGNRQVPRIDIWDVNGEASKGVREKQAVPVYVEEPLKTPPLQILSDLLGPVELEAPSRNEADCIDLRGGEDTG